MAPRPPCAQRPARRLDPPAYAPSPERRLPPSFPWLRLLAGVCLLPLAAWGAGALWFQFPGGAAARRGRGGLGRAASLAAGPADRRSSLARRPPLVGGVGAGPRRAAGLVAHAAAVQRPRLGRRGEPHAAGHGAGRPRAPADVRNFDWRGDADYDARWDTRDYDLSRLRSVDMILSTWGMPAIAHTLVSFGFDDGQRVVFSVEIRKERGEQFSELGGFFKQFELSVIAADERDIVRVRTAVRGETVSIYPIRMPPEAMRALFLSYVDGQRAARRAALLSHGHRQLHHHHLPDGARHRPACRSTTAFCCPATCPSTCTNTAAWTPAGRWTRSGAMPTSPSARPGRATRRRSRKPYANLPVPRP